MPATSGSKRERSSCKPAKYHGAFAGSGVRLGFARPRNGALNDTARPSATAAVPSATTTWRTSRCGHVNTVSSTGRAASVTDSRSTTPSRRTRPPYRSGAARAMAAAAGAAGGATRAACSVASSENVPTVERSTVGTFSEEATEQAARVAPPAAPAAAAMARAAPDLYGGRVRLLGVVDRESVTEAARPVDDTVFTWPHLLVRHVVVALGTAAVALGLAVSFSAPLRGLANPNLTPEPAKAPWYFAGLQELLSRFDPLVAGILVPGGAVLMLLLLPYIDRNPDTRAKHRKVAITLFSILLAIAVILTVVGTFFRGPGWKFIAPWTH